MTRLVQLAVAAVVVTIALPAPQIATAQTTEYQRKEHFLVGRPTMEIYVLGATGSPGPWKVSQDISFIELVSAILPEGLGNVPADVVQKATLDIYRSGPAGRQLVYSHDIRAVLRGEAPLPILQHHDLLVFENYERPKRFSFRTFTSLLGTTSTMILLYLRIRNL